MWIETLRMTNFGPFSDTTLNFKLGSIGIFGRNGSGKSTLLNGIYALVSGDFSRFEGVKTDCIRNTSAPGEKAFISGTIKTPDHSVQITRFLRAQGRMTTEVAVDGGKSVTDANKAQALIAEVLGVDRRILDLYVFKQQDKIYDFLSTTPAERAKAYQVLCGTEKCEVLWSMLNKFVSGLATSADIVDNSDDLLVDISEAEDELASVGEATQNAKSLLMNTTSKLFGAEQLKKHNDYSLLQTELVQVNELIKRYQAEIRPLRASVAELKVELEEAETRESHFAEGYEAAVRAVEQAKTYKKYRAERQRLESEREELKAEEKSKKLPVSVLDDFNLKVARQELYTMESELANARRQLKTLSASGVSECPTCGTSVNNLASRLIYLKAADKLLPGKIDALKKDIDAYESHQVAVERYNTWRNRLTDKLEGNKKAFDALVPVKKVDGSEASKCIGDYEAAKVTLVKVRRKLADCEHAYVKKESALSLQLDKKKNIEQRIEESYVDPELVENIRTRFAQHEEALLTIARLEGQAQVLQERISNRKTQVEALRTKMSRTKKLRDASKIAEKARDVLHRDCLPNRVAVANLARMEGEINAGLDLLGSPFWVESDESLSFRAHKPGEPAMWASRLSTGQRVILALAFWPAVLSLWSDRVGMLALDEPTANLDTDNRQLLADALSVMSANVRGRRQLLMVTHDRDLKDRFDQVIDLGETT